MEDKMQQACPRLELPDKQQIDAREKLERLFVRADYVVNKNYLMQIADATALAECGETEVARVSENTKFFRIDRIVYNKNENNLQKLTNLYAAAHVLGANVVLLLHSNGKTVDLYLGVADMDQRADPTLRAIFSNIRGNFPGSLGSMEDYNALCMTDSQMDANFNEWFGNQNDGLASVSGVPAIRGEQVEENQHYIQGLEKVIDTMRGQSFTAIILSKNISDEDLADIKAEYEMLYTDLSPYTKSILTYGESETFGVSVSLSHAVSQSEGANWSRTLSVGRTETNTHAVADGVTKTDTAGVYAGGGGQVFHAGTNYSHSHSRSQSITDSTSIGTTHTQADTNGGQRIKGVQDAEMRGSHTDCSSSLSRQLEYHNKPIEELLHQIDEQLKRIRDNASYGMFGTAAYFIAPSVTLAQTAASAYKSIISGRSSFVETAQICTWSRTTCSRKGRLDDFSNIINSLRCFRHPVFELPTGEYVTPASLVSGQELSIEMGLPMHSVPGVAVIESVPFGRNVYHLSDKDPSPASRIPLGNIYHMWEEEETPVILDKNSLTGHTFITGSTGCGKSNTIYHLLNEIAQDENTHFMVVEPAKGEYKDVFGGRNDVFVYGTNPKKAKLLQINPFAFPVDEVTVQEHLDRLVEIFNVCWPMYAAMPAILKDACERAYISAGWDITESVNRVDPCAFPSFSTVLEQVRTVIQESDYSADNKGDYTGALVTRIRSLTTGIFGQIFTNDLEQALSAEELFERNVIIDLSRIGSSETKALIMGLMVMQLQEHRAATQVGCDSELRHITVLEEAHNLLKRTSSEQEAESSNLAGKSVEMLSNAIAEMRTYGEGFIIADQAPGLLDMAAIRNTNTKIIMRLPDQSDRELVGKAAGLDDAQIHELAKLPKGVAVVYQNEWLDPVLCKVPQFVLRQPFSYQTEAMADITPVLQEYLYAQFIPEKAEPLVATDLELLMAWSKKKNLSPYTKQLFQRGMQEQLPKGELGALAYNLFNGWAFCQKLGRLKDEDKNVREFLMPFFAEYALPEDLALKISLTICEKALEITDMPAFRNKVERLRTGGCL